jgi:hypothetical protein
MNAEGNLPYRMHMNVLDKTKNPLALSIKDKKDRKRTKSGKS